MFCGTHITCEEKMGTHNISFYIVYLVKLHGLYPFLLLLFLGKS